MKSFYIKSFKLILFYIVLNIYNTQAQVTASDCQDAVHICTNLSFAIDPNGIGSTNEIPASGSFGNPLYNGGASMPAAWGDANLGCLQAGETNSTWMIINISGSGDLEFTFGGVDAGGNQTQAGFYDWIMYPYNASSCSDIPVGTVAPVRCNWNNFSVGGTGLAAFVPNTSAGGFDDNFQAPLAVITGEQYIICFSNYSNATTNVPLEFGGTAGISCVPLPIELLNFDIELIDRMVEINWSTLSEVNNDYFVVERSVDGIEFEEIEMMEGAGNSSQLINYKLIDESPNSGVNYYRLKQVDFNGDYEYSILISIRLENESNVKMYPNPANQNLIIEGLVSGDKIEFFNIMGKSLLKKELKFENEVINIETIPEGVYFVLIYNERTQKVLKLIKQ